LYESESIVNNSDTTPIVLGKPDDVSTRNDTIDILPPSTGTSIISDVPMTEPITTPIVTLPEVPTTGTSIIVEPPVEPIPVVPVVEEPPKQPTASVTITNVPLIGDGISGILGSIGGFGGGFGGGGGTGDESQVEKEISGAMPNLLLYLGIALVGVIVYKTVKK
jgi:hypothetical protein